MDRWCATIVAGLTVLVVFAVGGDLAPWLRGPAPYPPEWQWGLRAGSASPRLGAAALAAVALLLLLAASASGPARARPRVGARLLLALASVFGLAFQLALLEREPQGALRALMARALSPSISSYHTVAVSDQARDPLAFLAGHARLLPRLADGRKHAATHPPGPVLWYRGALAVCERAPSFADALLELAGVERRESQTRQGRSVRAAALLGALGLGLLGALTAWPLAALAGALGLSPLAAARVGILWTLLPGPALVSPALDATVALAVTGCAGLLARVAAAASWRDGALGGVLAGVCGAAAFFTTYGAAAFLAIAALAVIAAYADRPRMLAQTVAAAALAGIVTIALAFGVPALLGHAPLESMRTALEIHRALFTAPRRYALWLLFNPLDLALFVGVPVAVAGLCALGRASGRALRGRTTGRLDRFRLALAAALLLLLVLGVTRGEVGRLWIPLMPFVLLASVAAGSPSSGADRPAEAPGAVEAVFLGALTAALTLAIGSRWLM